jgi:hypothetical protein
MWLFKIKQRTIERNTAVNSPGITSLEDAVRAVEGHVDTAGAATPGLQVSLSV